jgi:hypothetical protein
MKKLFRKFLKKDKGGVMLVLLIYFLLTSLVIIAGFVSPTVREYKISNLGYQSRQSYFLSESGSEDAICHV